MALVSQGDFTLPPATPAHFSFKHEVSLVEKKRGGERWSEGERDE